MEPLRWGIGMRWSAEADVTLKSMWAAGVSARAIGKSLGRSRNSVIGRVHRLELGDRQPVIPAKQLAPVKPKVPKLPPPPDPGPTPMGPSDGEFPKHGQCRYPHGDSAPYTFCGHPGDPWCEFHKTLCLTPTRPMGQRVKFVPDKASAKVFGGKF